MTNATNASRERVARMGEAVRHVRDGLIRLGRALDASTQVLRAMAAQQDAAAEQVLADLRSNRAARPPKPDVGRALLQLSDPGR